MDRPAREKGRGSTKGELLNVPDSLFRKRPLGGRGAYSSAAPQGPKIEFVA